MATLYNINKNLYGWNGFASPFCDTIFSSALAANTDTSIAVPLNASPGMAPAQQVNNTFLAVFSYQSGSVVYVAKNVAAAAPAGAPFAASHSEINPPAKIVKAGDTIHMLCVAGCDVTIAFYSTQSN